MILNGLRQNDSAVYFRGPAGGNGGSVAEPLTNDAFDCARGVVNRHRLNLWMLSEKLPALRERDRVGQSLPDLTEGNTRWSDECK